MACGSLEDRIRRAVRETIEIAPYDSSWPERYEVEAAHLRTVLAPFLKRIKHVGSTAIPGMAAKPIVDVLAGVDSDAVAQDIVAPRLMRRDYEYFWRTDGPDPYAWFIKRGVHAERTYHIHVVDLESPMWERLLFRDFLRQHPDRAHTYLELKLELAKAHTNDREAYTRGKTEFIMAVMREARRYYRVS